MLKLKTSPASLAPCIFHGVTSGAKGNTPSQWHEMLDETGNPRPAYDALLGRVHGLRQGELRNLEERLGASLREMGVGLGESDGKEDAHWECSVLPQVFTADEWQLVERGVDQRLRAFELFLRDIYSGKGILHRDVIPIQPVLGSAHYLAQVSGLPLPGGNALHLCGLCLTRGPEGQLAVRHHHISRASGISYMMQNRRALARVWPEVFNDFDVRSSAEAPETIIEHLHNIAEHISSEPSVVLLTPGPASFVYSEHTFLARRMGIPLVQGGDLLVLDDCLYLKTVQGLKRVHVVYNRVADQFLDPLVLRMDTTLGVPGLLHCLRRGTVLIANAPGANLADDKALLSFSTEIIRYYLGERPILPTVPTYWLGDIDQREMVIEDIEDYEIRSVRGDDLHPPADTDFGEPAVLQAAIRRDPRAFIAQPRNWRTRTLIFHPGKKAEHLQDHLLFALRNGEGFSLFPGALTRIHPFVRRGQSEKWSSRDTWVLTAPDTPPPSMQRRPAGILPITRQITSRVAEAFYWLGRYLERAYHQAYLIQTIETLETEELTDTERRLYRPLWNRLLPPLESAGGDRRRSIVTRSDRYQLVLSPEAGSVWSTIRRAISNAENVLEVLSPEAWSAVSELRVRFERMRFREGLADSEAAKITRRLAEATSRLVPQFYATASMTMLADDGWRFCEIGSHMERAVLTSNAVRSITKSFARGGHGLEIELSAFLRLLGTRDAYRRVYQTRAEPIPVLELLWQNQQVPRSVARCLYRCALRLKESAPDDSTGGPAQRAVLAIDELQQRIRSTDWTRFLAPPSEDGETPAPQPPAAHELDPHLFFLSSSLLELHTLMADCFLNHQASIAEAVQSEMV